MYKKVLILLLLVFNVCASQAQSQYYTANAAYANHLYRESIRIITSVINKEPSDTAYFLRASSEVRLRRINEALSDFDAAIKINPKYINARMARALINRDLKLEDKALKDLDTILNIDSTYCNAIINKGMAMYYVPPVDTNKVLSYLNKGLRKCPNFEAYFIKGCILSDAGKDSEAIIQYNSSSQLDSINIENYVNRGISYLYIEKYDFAIRDFNHALKYIPKNKKNREGIWDICYHRAWAEYGAKLYSDALADINHAMKLGTREADVYYLRGIIFLGMQNYKKARADLMRASLDKRIYRNVFVLIAETDTSMGQYDEAVKLLTEKIAEFKGELFPLAYDMRGDIYFKQGKKEEACADWKMAVEQTHTQSEEKIKKYCK
jgi:tetratricopeptide (TPR) repeat protein